MILTIYMQSDIPHMPMLMPIHVRCSKSSIILSYHDIRFQIIVGF